MNRNYTHILIAAALILMAAAARIVNADMQLYNLAPVAALGLFAGAVVRNRPAAFLLPLLGQFAADLYFQFFTNTPGFYADQWFTYGGLIGATALGMLMRRPRALNVLGFTLGASTIFFLVSNFGVWLQGWYGTGFDALVVTYAKAIPFYRNTLLGDLAGSGLLFGLYALMQRAFAQKLAPASSR